jgi:hypothetical protein
MLAASPSSFSRAVPVLNVFVINTVLLAYTTEVTTASSCVTITRLRLIVAA